MATPLWDVKTYWHPHNNEVNNYVYPYNDFHDFKACAPYKNWKPYFLSSWSWDLKKRLFQIVFVSPQMYYKTSVVEFPVKEEHEPAIRQWLKKHMSPLWDI
jgi:hypothetical protein